MSSRESRDPPPLADGIALIGDNRFIWPAGIDVDTKVAVVQFMLLALGLARSGHGELVVRATAHALQTGGYRGEDGA